MTILIILLVAMVLAAFWSVMTSLFLRATIALALTSVILTVIMFQLGAPLAAVFELSVCAGLISVIFISVISLTQPMTFKETLDHMKERLSRFWGLPLIVVILGIALALMTLKSQPNLAITESHGPNARFILWHLRQFDLVGQIIILFTGVFGVVILFKERNKRG